MRAKLIILLLSVSSVVFGQTSITKIKVTADTVRARVDSLYLKGNISVNGENIYELFDSLDVTKRYVKLLNEGGVKFFKTGDTLKGVKYFADSVRFYVNNDSITLKLLSDLPIYVNGLTLENDSVKWGGNIIEDTGIKYDLGGGVYYSDSLIDIGGEVMRVLEASNGVDTSYIEHAGDGMVFGIKESSLQLLSTEATLSYEPIGYFEIRAGVGAKFYDLRTVKRGIEYVGNFNSTLGDSSLVPKRYVDSAIAANTPAGVMTFETLTFDDTISFTSDKMSYEPYTVSSNTTIIEDLINSKYEATASFAFTGNGTNTLTFPTNWRNIGDLTFNNINGLTNYGIAYKQGSRITYNIYDTLLADVIAPVLDSAWQVDSTQILALFSEPLNTDSLLAMATSAITLTGATVSSFTGSNSDTMKVNLATNAVATAISYTQPASNRIQDLSENLTASWTDSTVYNNIPPAGEASFTINTANNISKSGDDYTATGGSGFVNYCLFNESLAASTDGYIILNYDSTADGTVIVGFDAVNSNKDYNSYDFALYLAQGSGDTRAITNGSLGSTIQTSSTGSKFKIDRASGTVTIQYASDGVNFSTIHTFGGSSTIQLYVNLNISNVNEDCRSLKNEF